jgi:hypothetical protein
MALITAADQSNISSPVSQQRLSLAFSKDFLTRLEKQNPSPVNKFAREYPIMQRQGYKVIITLTTALTVTTAPLAAPQAAKNQGLTTSNIALTLNFYGNDIGWDLLFDMTAVDIAKQTHAEELVMNAKESITQLTLDQMDLETVVSEQGAMTYARAVEAARELFDGRTRPFDELGGNFVGLIGPFAWEDLHTEQNAAYKDHYQTVSGSEVLADGQMSKPAGGIQFFKSNYNRSVGSLERQYFWGKDALARTELVAALAGVNGRPIGLDNIASVVAYVIPAQAQLSDIYGLEAHCVWRGGPIACAVGDSARIVTLDISQ